MDFADVVQVYNQLSLNWDYLEWALFNQLEDLRGGFISWGERLLLPVDACLEGSSLPAASPPDGSPALCNPIPHDQSVSPAPFLSCPHTPLSYWFHSSGEV